MGLRDWIPPVLWRKASAVSRAIVMLTNGQPVWTPRDFEKLSKEGFEQNVTVYACVMEVARSAAGIPWLLYQRGRGRRNLIEIEDHPLLNLIEKPNEFQGQAAFFEAATAYLLLSGNQYIEGVGPSDTAPPRELWNLRPDRVRIIPSTQSLVAGYRYSVGATTQDFPTELVLHQKLFSPVDDWYGLSPLAVAGRSVDADNAAQKWNVALLQNQARPSGALISKNNLEQEQYDRLKADVEDKYTGARNAGRPLLLEGDMDWKQFSLSPDDMDWANSRKMSKLEICQVFGVPPELIGDHEHATYSNFQEARKAFYQETVLPYMDRLRDSLNNWLAPKFGDRLWLDYDRDEIEALQEERQKVWESAINAVKSGVLTPNEARDRMGYDERPEGNVLLVSAAMLPLGESFAHSDEDEGNKGTASVATVELKNFLKAFGLETEEAKSVYWKKVDRAREAWAGKFASRLRGLFEAEGKAVAKAIEDASEANAEEEAYRALNRRRVEWERTLAATYLAVIEAFAESVQEGLKADAGGRKVKAFDLWSSEVQQWIAVTVAEKVKLISDFSRKKIQLALAEGVAAGEGTDALAKRLQQLYRGFAANRSHVIARTEVIGAAGFGSRQGAKQTGLPLKKEWIGTRDGRERESHAALDGKKFGMDEVYPNGVMFPGDPSGDPEEVIQCRCTEGYHVDKGDE